MKQTSKTAGKTATNDKSQIERGIMTSLEKAREIVIRRADIPADAESKRTDLLSVLDRLHDLAQLYRGDDTKSFTENDITYTDGTDRVAITITGRAFANLKEITEITNKWTEDDFTPTGILREFYFTDPFLNLNEKNPNDGKTIYSSSQTLSGAIAAEFSEGAELRRLFESAGFNTCF